MKRRKPVFTMFSYGEYEPWDRESKKIPKIKRITTEIEAETGTEFGYVLRIKNGKGTTLSFKIDHPAFADGTVILCLPLQANSLFVQMTTNFTWAIAFGSRRKIKWEYGSSPHTLTGR